MGVSYRDELKKAAKRDKARSYPRGYGGSEAAAARSNAIKRQQSRQAVYHRATQAAQGRLLDA